MQNQLSNEKLTASEIREKSKKMKIEILEKPSKNFTEKIVGIILWILWMIPFLTVGMKFGFMHLH